MILLVPLSILFFVVASYVVVVMEMAVEHLATECYRSIEVAFPLDLGMMDVVAAAVVATWLPILVTGSFYRTSSMEMTLQPTTATILPTATSAEKGRQMTVVFKQKHEKAFRSG